MIKYCRPLHPKEILTVYRTWGSSHFPDDELKPLSAIKALIEQKQYSGYGLFTQNEKGAGGNEETEELLGYALLLHDLQKEKMLLDYYAFVEEHRNKGLGSHFLQEMRRQEAFSGCYLECEDPETASSAKEHSIRTRRICFYQRNGAYLTKVQACLFGVDYRMLWLPAAASCVRAENGAFPCTPALENEQADQERILQDLKDFYLSIYPSRIFDEKIKLWLP